MIMQFCTRHEAERFLAVPFAEVFKPGYETFERPRFERGTCRLTDG